MITEQEVNKAQEKWAESVIQIGKLKDNKNAHLDEALKLLDDLYAYDSTKVLFKPTKAAEAPFRLEKEAALSYFVGGNNNFPEDGGFALQPWRSIRFENASFIFEEKRALVMGHYYFKDDGGKELKVEYSFGYRKMKDDRLKIDLHHSSLPFKN
ncbi:MAG: hypothetical protein CME68_09230 [Halobacteriovoraceae bacterium]|nr:hypothetical protein [Halobacteriovoraceae bacterium]